MTTLGEVCSALEQRYPVAGAEPWDAVGLVTGTPDQPVATVLGTVDVTDAVLSEAEELGADLVLAHHPLLLRGLHAATADDPKGRLLTRLIRSGIAVITAHTNADIPAGGVADALAAALGLSATRPLSPRPGPALDKITSYVPPDRVADVLDALADAGAGAIGRYDRCAFTSPGTGRFRPLAGSTPYLGTPGQLAEVAEVRLEMVLPRERRATVVAALLHAHPYETPAYDVVELADTGPATAGLGRVGELATPCSLSAFADRVVAALPPTPAGIRIAGDLDRPVSRIAVQAGAGDDLFAEVRASGADVYLTSDLRHHPASEALAFEQAPALIDVPHWAAEWTWLPVVAEQLRALNLTVHVSTLCTDPWTSTRR